MAKRKYDFDDDTTRKALLWCARHCCLCGKFAGVSIEIAHLEPKNADPDNAIPLCFDCHATIGHYNDQQPKGKKYRPAELKLRRDQVYDLRTQHLVSRVDYRLTQCEHGGQRSLPDVGFHITHLGTTIYPLRARITIILRNELTDRPLSPTGRHYDGNYFWNLNSGKGCNGHFSLPPNVNTQTLIRARIEVTLYDIYHYKHKQLPVGFIHPSGGKDWYYEPSEEEFGLARV